MATSAHAGAPRGAGGGAVPLSLAAPAAYGLGAVALIAEAVVHVQQFFSIFHEVRWVGPLFLANAAACVVLVAAMTFPPTRLLGALGGVVVSVLALGSLVISYGHGFLGWQEGGFRTPIAIAAIAEVVSVLALTLALTASAAAGGRRR